MPELTRRTILKAGAGAAVVAASTSGINAFTKKGSTSLVEPFFGTHQAGVSTAPQEHATWVSFKVKEGFDKEAFGRLMRVWSTDAQLLTTGKQALADNESTLAQGAANLTITFGVGPELATNFGLGGLHQIPSLSIDDLDAKWTGGDLVIQICANDQVKVHHAARELITDAKPFAAVHWQQSGFLPSTDLANNQTPRNLMGQKDGTANFKPDSQEFANAVWIKDGPASGGTVMVLRRIRMDLDKWETLSPDLKSKSIGRDIESGAPLSGGDEFSPADFKKADHHGLVIPADSHFRRARLTDSPIHRRGYNYRTESDSEGKIDQGLIFVSFQSSLHQFMQIQNRLESMDSLNTWTTPIGSAVFLIPPGIESGQWIGHTLI